MKVEDAHFYSKSQWQNTLYCIKDFELDENLGIWRQDKTGHVIGW